MGNVMYHASSEVIDAGSKRAPVSLLIKGRDLLARKGDRWVIASVTGLAVQTDGLAVTICTVTGRRLICAGSQQVAVRGKTGLVWKNARAVTTGNLVYTVADGVLGLDRVSCVVHAERPGEPWIRVKTSFGNLFAEEIMCRAN
jgi:hypothetical protein